MADIKYIIPFTYKWEGGLSRATTDSASKNPANISPYTINGQSGWHTNKGITYSVFKAGASKYGYQDTLNNWKDMPHDIWLKITKSGYWDRLKLDTYNSQPVANVMFSWVWGSGLAWQPRMERYLKTKGINWARNNFGDLATNLNGLVTKDGEKKIFDELVEQKKQFLLSLKGTDSNPVTDAKPQGVYTDGWMNRLRDLQTYSYTLLSKTITDIGEGLKNNSGKIIVFFFAFSIIAGGIVLYNNAKS